MGNKGEQTKRLICSAAYELFAQKGFKEVTMQDICERTKLSRGGLYRHYRSTDQIFTEIITALLSDQGNEFREKMRGGIPAAEILEDVLTRYEREMLDKEHSLSVAIYEFFSNPAVAKSGNSISQQYTASKRMWLELLEYGMRRNEFQKVEPEAVFDLIVFSYQGVRMYSRLMPVDEATPKRITGQIRNLLIEDYHKKASE